MGIYTTKPIKEIDIKEFSGLVKNKKVAISPHAIFRLSNRQRKVFKEDELINIVNKETPRKAYLQENERYAVYYRKSDGYRKLIIEVKNKETIIITFMDITEIPKFDQ